MLSNFLGQLFLLDETEFHGLVNLSPQALETMRSSRLEGTWTVKNFDGVAVMDISGPISRYDSILNWIRGGVALEDMAKDFRAAENNSAVKAIILNFDTPGGEATGIHEFAEMVNACKKPVVSYVGGACMSAGLWIASAAGKIVCDPTAELGSLGVVFGYRKGSDQGSIIEIVSAVSPKKRLDPGTKEGREEIQQRADDLAEIFISQVAKYRRTTTDKVESDFGQGGVMIAKKAIAVGMADKLGSLDSVINELRKKTNSGGPMGLRTELRALIAGKDDTDVEAAFAAVGFFPKSAEVIVPPDTADLEAERLAEGVEAGKAKTMARVGAIMQKCELAGVVNPKFISDVLSMSEEDAAKKIIDAKADESDKACVFSTVNPMSTGGENPLVADAKNRSKGAK